MTQTAIDEVRRIVRALMDEAELTRESVEKCLNVRLQHSADVGETLLYYEADISAGPFGHVELRQPNPQQKPSWLLILSVRDGVKLPLADFQNDLIPAGPPQDINPHIPPEGADTYIVTSSSQSVHFEFRARSGMLQLVALHRPPSGS